MESLTEKQFQRWGDYYQLDPFGWGRFDIGLAMLRADMLNMMRGEDDDPIHPEDIMPQFGMTEQEREEYQREKQASKAKRVPRKLRRALGQLG